MNKYYFTFGSDPRFPYGRNEYVVVEAPNEGIARMLFSMVHKPRNEAGLVNCSMIYPEDEFNSFRDQWYKGVEPVEIISMKVEVKRRDEA